MSYQGMKYALSLVIGIATLQANAADIIKVMVKTKIPSTVAIGYRVDGSNSGSLGSVHKGLGQKNKEYIFGYRKNSILSKDIRCGSVTLNKDTTITLVHEKDRCQIVLSD